MPTLVSINVRTTAEVVKIGARLVETGIRKQPVERAEIHALGLAGDVVADKENHGGPDQAVYVYSAEDLAWWGEELGVELEPGAFGENLTFSSLGNEPVHIGDCYRVGTVTLQATAARIPCSVFQTHLGQHDWVKRFAAARRPGLYARVLEPGTLSRGDEVELLGGGEAHPELLATSDHYFDPEPPRAIVEALLASPLAERARKDYEEKLERSTRAERA